MPDLPPLMDGRVTPDEPFAAAVAAAREGCDGGLVLHRPAEDALDAALVLAPEVPLGRAMAMAMAAQVAMGDALGALAPPETALHFEWPGGFRVNGARCGTLRVAAATTDAAAVPDWLVLALSIPFEPEQRSEPGDRPDETALREEGIVDLSPDELLSSWARHMLVWIDAWSEGGMRRLHEAWRGRAWKQGEQVEVQLPRRSRRGIFRGLDEDGGLLLEVDGATQLIPLTEMLEVA